MKYCEKLDYYLSRDFKNSDAMEFLNSKLEKFPYDYLKLVKFGDESYQDFNKGANITYIVDEVHPRNITVILDTHDGLKKRKIILEIRWYGNEVNLITMTPKEDTNVFHIKYYRSDTFNVLNKRVKFYGSDREEVVNISFSKFDRNGDLLDFKETDDFIEKNDNFTYNKTRLF